MAKSTNPFRYFDSSPEVIRLVVMMYVRYPLSLRNVEAADPRITALLARKPVRVATVAMANRAARAIWAIMVRGEVYRAPETAAA